MGRAYNGGVVASFQADEFGRLTCNLSDGKSHAVVTASDLRQAAAGLANAISNCTRNGLAECFWYEAGGDYRWVLRRCGDAVRLAVLWSSGTLTGWEHVFWTECPANTLYRTIGDGLGSIRP